MPRRWLSWPMTAPWNSSGACTSTFMIGSRIVGLALAYASRKPMRAAVRNAISDESTAWEAPSLIDALTPTTGKPISGPFLTASRKPFSQAGMNSRGIDAADDVVDELEAARLLGRQRLDVAAPPCRTGPSRRSASCACS